MNFLGISADEAVFDRSKIVVLPIPYEATTSYGKGTANGPTAIIEASAQVEFFDEELECEPYKCGIHTADAVIFNGATGKAAIDLIERAVDNIFSAGKFPLGLGGEHTITTGLVKAALKTHPKLTVVHFDAHADMRDEYEGTPWSHACVMRRIHELGVKFVSIGIRAISSEEYDFIRSKELLPNYFFAHRIAKDSSWIKKALSIIEGPVFLTFDIDALDSSIVPATGTPVPGGLNWYQATDFIRELTKDKEVVGADLVELAPNVQSQSSNFTAAILAHKIIGYKLCKQVLK